MESTWANLVATHNPLKVEFVGTVLVQTICFWVPSALYLSLDTLMPAFSAQHKLQPAPKQPTRAEIRECALLVFRNQLISLALAALSTALSATTGRPPPVRVDASLPGAGELARDLLLCCAMREVLFYYVHRLFHASPRLYQAVHKQHHRFRAPVALAAQYAHPAEHLLANTLPVALPPMLLHSHVVTFWAFIGLMLVETATVHSGYDFFAGAARKHDAHHERFNLNYGAFGWMDWLHGTDGRNMKEKKG